MKLCYALQPAFYDAMKQSGDIQALLDGMDEQQRSRIQIPIEAQTLQESAEAFFQKEIACREDCLCYDHFLKSRVYEVYIREGGMVRGLHESVLSAAEKKISLPSRSSG